MSQRVLDLRKALKSFGESFKEEMGGQEIKGIQRVVGGEELEEACRLGAFAFLGYEIDMD